MSTMALERLPLTEVQLSRLLGAIDALLAEVDKERPTSEEAEIGRPRPLTAAEKEEAERIALGWIERAKKHRQEAMREAGEDVDPAEVSELFAEMQAEVVSMMQGAADGVISGEITPHRFYLDMERAIRIHFRSIYIAGKVEHGGDARLSKAEEKALWAWQEDQVRHLGNFYQAIRDGQQSEAQIRARTAMYERAIQAPYRKGHAAALGAVDLPQVPGDGQTRCRTNCKCYLEYEQETSAAGKVVAVNVYWRLRPAEHCDDCVALAARWSPLRVEVK